jgi:hypothetical protein
MAYVALIYCKTCGMRTEPEPNLCACLPGPVERVNNAFVDLRRLREENARLREALALCKREMLFAGWGKKDAISYRSLAQDGGIIKRGDNQGRFGALFYSSPGSRSRMESNIFL